MRDLSSDTDAIRLSPAPASISAGKSSPGGAAAGGRAGWGRRRATASALVLLSGLVSALPVGGASQAADGRYVRSLLEMRRDKVVVQEWDLSCGAAALATILNYQHGDPVPEEEIARELIRREEYIANPQLVRAQQGFSFLDLQRYVNQRGYEGAAYGRLTFEDLLELAPIMVPVNFNNYNHFVVFRGARGNRVLLADPAFGNRTTTVERFMNAWVSYPEIRNVGFVVKRRDGAVPPNRLAPRPSDYVTLG